MAEILFKDDIKLQRSQNQILITFCRWIDSEGIQGAKRIKTMQWMLIKFLCSDLPSDFKEPYITQNDSGFPILVQEWQSTFVDRVDIRRIKFLLTVFNVHRIFLGGSEVDLTSITDKGDYNIKFSEIEKAFELLVSRNDLEEHLLPIKEIYSGKNQIPHQPNSSGPNGPALKSLHLDSLALSYDNNLITHFEVFEKITKFRDPINYLKKMISTFSEIVTPKSNFKVQSSSRLVVIPDRSTKSRVVAQVDYFTQWMMNPFLIYLGHLVSKINGDFMLDQLKGIEKITSWTQEGRQLYSVDLSSATDRLPVHVQSWVVSLQTKSVEFGDIWQKILTDREFRYDDKQIRYSVGQPMGVKTSFHMLDIFHHVIVMLAAHRINHPIDSQRYAIVGDDIVMEGERLSNSYITVMKDLGVKISVFKGVRSSEGVSCAEFCKRIIVNGVDFSPQPFGEILHSQGVDNNFTALEAESFSRFPFESAKEFLEFSMTFLRDKGFLNMVTWLTSPAIKGRSKDYLQPLFEMENFPSLDKIAKKHDLTLDHYTGMLVAIKVRSAMINLSNAINSIKNIKLFMETNVITKAEPMNFQNRDLGITPNVIASIDEDLFQSIIKDHPIFIGAVHQQKVIEEILSLQATATKQDILSIVEKVYNIRDLELFLGIVPDDFRPEAIEGSAHAEAVEILLSENPFKPDGTIISASVKIDPMISPLIIKVSKSRPFMLSYGVLTTSPRSTLTAKLSSIFSSISKKKNLSSFKALFSVSVDESFKPVQLIESGGIELPQNV